MLASSLTALIYFLSHLSGDEGANGGRVSTVSFLSHLSGDEGRLYL